MRRKAAYIKVFGLLTALFFVVPNACLCGLEHADTSSDVAEAKDLSGHCHDEVPESQSTEPANEDCCGSSQHNCVQDVAV
ncbi:MAG: hypothetical protein KDD48_08820, partial [Bdellovibrionales bacterium]|nr:hypothetical protein [Bdellovibrionales bacterium]